MCENNQEKEWKDVSGNKRSIVWKYFQIHSKNSKKLRCIVCKEQLNFNSSTSTLRYHIVNIHNIVSHLYKPLTSLKYN